jgi:hypothetical protein
MNSQVALAAGIVNGRVHTDQDHALLRNVELAQQSERSARRARRSAIRRSH